MKKSRKPSFRKVTLNLPTAPLEAALAAGGSNITQTVRAGLELIAQNCIYSKVPLLTRDKDFRHYEKFGELFLISK